MNIFGENKHKKMSVRIVSGNLLNSPEKYIIHQCNCYTVKAHGLSLSIFEKYPWADCYSERRQFNNRNLAIPKDCAKFGGVKIIYGPREKKAIVCLFAQLCPGKPNRFRSYPYWETDTSEMRLIKFRKCLKKFGKYCEKRGIKSVAFPYRIGCGLAGGNWKDYYHAIDYFSRKYSVISILYKYSPK